jgi:hypothetical protein
MVMFVAGVIIAIGGVFMMQRKAYGFAITSSVICMLPCVTICGCCLIGEGIGIWALVVLLSHDIKQLF